VYQLPQYCSNSSSLVGETSPLYYFNRINSNLATVLEGSIQLWEHINSKRKPQDSTVSLILAVGKIDPTKDEPMTLAYLERASPARPSTLEKYNNPAIQPRPKRQNTERRHKSQEKDQAASDYIQKLYQDPESKLYHGFNEAHANHMCMVLASKKTFGVDKKQMIWEVFPCNAGEQEMWPSMNQIGMPWNSAHLADFFDGVLPEKDKFPPNDTDIELPPPAPSKIAKPSEASNSAAVLAGAFTAGTAVLANTLQSCFPSNNGTESMSTHVTFRFTRDVYSICHVVDLSKKTTFKQEYTSLMEKEFGTLAGVAAENSGVFSLFSDVDIKAMEDKKKYLFFEIPNVGKLRKDSIETCSMAQIEKMTTADRPINVTVSVEAPASTTTDEQQSFGTRLMKL
jgi:hypothetical protein